MTQPFPRDGVLFFPFFKFPYILNILNCQSIYGNLKKMKSSTPSRGKGCVNLTPANDCPGYVTCASRKILSNRNTVYLEARIINT